MIKRLAELQDLCVKLGLQVPRSAAREAKRDYLDALRQHFLLRDFPLGSTPYQELVPMQCFPYWDLRFSERESLWRDQNNWLCQQKINGCRAVVHFVRGVGVFCHGRNIDTATFRRTELTDHLLFAGVVPTFSAVVDTEVVVEKGIDTAKFTPGGGPIESSLQAVTALLALKPESARLLQKEQDVPLQFKTFDIPVWDGRDLRKKELCERLPYLADFDQAVSQTDAGQYFTILPTQLHGKRLFFDRLLTQGAEGVVFKHLHSTYEDNTSRNRKGWVKVKRSVELDAFVCRAEVGKPNGRYRNKIATLVFAVRTEEGNFEIAKVSSIPRRSRAAITIKDPATKEVKVHPSIIGKVAHLVGQELTPKSMRLLHPKIVRWDDRLGVAAMDRCSYSMASIRSGQLRLPLIERGEEGQMGETVH